MDFKEILNGVFPEDTEEFEEIKNCYDLITKSSISLISEAKSHLFLLDRSQIKLSTIYYLLSRRISSIRESIQSDYDASYTSLVRRGRPSKDSVESEIRSTNPVLYEVFSKISKLEDVKELVSLYLKCIDSSRKTAVEVIRTSGRID